MRAAPTHNRTCDGIRAAIAATVAARPPVPDWNLEAAAVLAEVATNALRQAYALLVEAPDLSEACERAGRASKAITARCRDRKVRT